jgi:hypothetical protein
MGRLVGWMDKVLGLEWEKGFLKLVNFLFLAVKESITSDKKRN